VLLAAFGGLALLLAALGIAGVLATSVSRRTQELGLRLALGAQSNDLLRMVIREAWRWRSWVWRWALPQPSPRRA
jgi:ABC-type antimicrobial peptide transport system permease subunit